MAKSKNASRIGATIDANLKRAYDDVLQEQVPDRFLTLLAQLRAAEQHADKRDSSDDS